MAEKTKITKQFVISQTVLYVFILAFVVIFKTIFGEKNTLIGVTSITAMLMLTQINLTISPGKNLFKLIIINLGIGLFTYVANLNIWGAIPLNFIGIFIIAYTFYYNLRSPVYLPFSLQYLFLLATPITAAELPIRLASLLVGPIGIMLMQFIVNKNKTTKVGDKLIGSICDELIKKINANNTNNEAINKSIKSSATEFRKIIYDNRKDNFYITEEGRIKLNIVIILEKFSNLLDENINNKQLLNDLIICLQELKRSLGKEDNLNDIINKMNSLLNNYKKENIKDLVSLRILNTINMLNMALEELKSTGKENYNTIKSSKDIPQQFKRVNIYKKEFYTKSVKFSYAIRVSLGITVSAFIADYFKLAEGKWIYFTALSIIIPIYELSKKKIRDRMFATLVGGVITVLLFTIFTNTLARVLIIMVAGYLRSYTSTYRYGTIYSTICAIGSAAMLGGAVVLTVDRILFVILGVIIGIIINRLVFPVRMKDANNELLEMYKNVVNGMLKQVYEEAKNENDNSHEIDTLLLISTMIEEKIATNNGDSITEEDNVYFDKVRILVIDIYQLYTLVKRSEVKHKKVDNMIEDLNILASPVKENIDKIIKNIEEHIISAKDIENKMIFSSIRGIFAEIKDLKEVSIRLLKEA